MLHAAKVLLDTVNAQKNWSFLIRVLRLLECGETNESVLTNCSAKGRRHYEYGKSKWIVMNTKMRTKDRATAITLHCFQPASTAPPAKPR
jgi:hypothetical protein